MRAADVMTPDPVCILVARPNAADFAKRDLWNVRSGPHPIVTFAALIIGVQRAISLFTNTASGCWPRLSLPGMSPPRSENRLRYALRRKQRPPRQRLKFRQASLYCSWDIW